MGTRPFGLDYPPMTPISPIRDNPIGAFGAFGGWAGGDEPRGGR